MLKLIYDKKEDIPEGLESHYTEKDGKFYLQVEGAKTQEDVDRVSNALNAERDARKEAEKNLAKYKNVDLEKWEKVKDLDPDNPPTGEGATADPDSKEFQKAVSEAVRAKEKEIQEKFNKDKEALENQAAEAQQKVKKYLKDDWMRRNLAAKFGFKDPDMLDDFMIRLQHPGNNQDLKKLSKLADSIEVQIEDGAEPQFIGGHLKDAKGAEEALQEVASQDITKRYKPAANNQGGGAGNQGESGSGSGNNPFKKDKTGEYNRTEAGSLIRNDKDKAKTLAKEAGWTEQEITW